MCNGCKTSLTSTCKAGISKHLYIHLYQLLWCTMYAIKQLANITSLGVSYFPFKIICQLFFDIWHSIHTDIFAKSAFFGNFGYFQAEYGAISSNLLEKEIVTWQHAFPSTNIAFYDISAQACAEIKSFFCLSFFSFSFLFAAVIDWPSTGLLPVQKILSKHHQDWHFSPWKWLLAMCSCKKFCSKFFTLFCEHFGHILWLHLAHHSDLGINGKIFSSSRIWAWIMPILVIGDDIRSGTKATTHNGKRGSQWVKKHCQ